MHAGDGLIRFGSSRERVGSFCPAYGQNVGVILREEAERHICGRARYRLPGRAPLQESGAGVVLRAWYSRVEERGQPVLADPAMAGIKSATLPFWYPVTPYGPVFEQGIRASRNPGGSPRRCRNRRAGCDIPFLRPARWRTGRCRREHPSPARFSGGLPVRRRS